jgi:uroporphyrinogen III methyltransferase/synthase
VPDSGPPGLVTFVGAGPGDPGLMTLRGRRAIERADVVLYDRLASPALLASVEVPGQERIHVGKTAGDGLSQQARINALLVKRALAGARVVRLQGRRPADLRAWRRGDGGLRRRGRALRGGARRVVDRVGAVRSRASR